MFSGVIFWLKNATHVLVFYHYLIKKGKKRGKVKCIQACDNKLSN